jgi:PAS domain S-box-containing protein
MRTGVDSPGDDGPTAYDLRLAQGLAELATVQLQLDAETLRRKDSEALFDRVFSAMADAVLLVDPRGEVSRANQAAVRLTGRAASDLVGKRPTDVFGPGVPTSPWELFQRAPGGTVESIDTYIHGAGDRARPVSVSCAAIQDASGKVVGAVYAARDTSRRKEAEEHREAQLRLTQILAASRTIAEVVSQVLEAIGESFGWRLCAGWLLEPARSLAVPLDRGRARCHGGRGGDRSREGRGCGRSGVGERRADLE